MMSMPIVCALVMIVSSLWSRHRYATHAACHKGCTSEHPRVIAGNEGMAVAAAAMLIVMLIERGIA